jgi:hypothetical protein
MSSEIGNLSIPYYMSAIEEDSSKVINIKS